MSTDRDLEEDPEPPSQDMKNFATLPNHSRQPPAYTDREMWIAIRSGILGVVGAIDTFADKGPLTMAVRAALIRISTAIALRWGLKQNKTN